MFRPTLFGKYLLTHRLSVGGMAEIFKAKVYGVGGFEKDLVVKQILPQYATYREFVDMFIDEAKITVSLNHGNIVPVYELGRIEGVYFIAMEYVYGRDLGQVLLRARELERPMSPEAAVAVIIDMLKGLDYAHRRKDRQGRPMGIVHRDVSPQNVIVSFDGEVKLLDFGIAKAAQKLSQTHPGAVRGKFSYLSPEMASGEPVDRRTDIFSAGIVLWEALTLQRLFTGSNEAEVLRKISVGSVQPPSSVRPKLPTALDPIVLKALARDPADRYKDAAAFQLALSKFLYSSRGGVTSESIGDYMKDIFASQIAKEEAAEQDPSRQEEIQRLYDELAIKTRQQATDPGRKAARQPRGRRQATQPGIGTDDLGATRTPTRPFTDRSQAVVNTGEMPARVKTGHGKTPVSVSGQLDGDTRQDGAVVTSDSLREVVRTGPLDPNLALDEMLAEMAPSKTASTDKFTPEEDALPDLAILDELEYEVFAARGGDDAALFAETSRARPLGWMAAVVIILLFAGYIVYSQTGLFRGRDRGPTKTPQAQSYAGTVAVKMHPEEVRRKDGNPTVGQLYWHQGDSPVTLEDLPLEQEVDILVELAGYRPQKVLVPREAWIRRPGVQGTTNTHERRLRLTLRPGQGEATTLTVKPPAPDEASPPPPRGHTGRLILDTDPAGAPVWLHVGTRFEGEGLSPKRLHRFMAILPERGRRVLTLRPFVSPDNPGDWRVSPTGTTVTYSGEINFEEEQ
ncbi:MAG: serine/threonine-protein kinase [Polyangia bacterium]|jgi:serine/threonine protein kinase|nr:serine/threonine-protein kinase [Polyangia bacterium]